MAATEDGDILARLQENLDSDPDNASNQFNLGLFLWKRGEELGGEGSKEWKERAAEHFVAAAKLSPSDGPTFRYLGHYYGRVSVEANRASKCYQRALTLSPDDSEAGEALCDLLDGGGKESLEIAVCREASGKSPRAFWAFRRLGYLQVHQKKWSEAVKSLQHAIRGYPACAELWEALGLAYRHLGMFTAALKSYGRVIELEDTRVFALIESGNIQLMLGSCRKGIEQFRRALEIAPQSVSAHFGLASGLLGLSKECVNFGAFSWGAALLEEASIVAKASTCMAGAVYSAWKLHGDVQIAYARCFPWEEERIDFDEKILQASINHWKRTCLSAAKSAKQSYQRALHLTPWQANIYTDIAISLDLIFSLEERCMSHLDLWQLPVRMSLGALMLEGVNTEFWVIFGSLSDDHAFKQHAFIRALQLDASISNAWAYLGKLYRKLGEKQFAKLAFDHARSIDPSLPIPWAAMSADHSDGKCSPIEAYESCLRAVQILPLAHFQIGLGGLSARSGQLLSPQVLGAVRQAVQRVPYYAEAHNLNGLVHEARKDYESSINSYRKARYALKVYGFKETLETHFVDVSVNIARALCLAGHALDAVRECEDLRHKGLLDNKGLQMYAVALWQLGKNDLALSMVRDLSKYVPDMEQSSAAAALGLICKLLYHIQGQDSAIETIIKLPRELLGSTKLSFVLSSFFALSPSSQPQLLLLSNIQTVKSLNVISEIHSIIAISKMRSNGLKQDMKINSGANYLRKVLHMYPNSSLIRSQLGSLLLSDSDQLVFHRATRCIGLPTLGPINKDLELAVEIHGAAGVACYARSAPYPKFSFPSCKDQLLHGPSAIHLLQRWLHQEPWNQRALYLLILNVLQKAREEKFPPYLCTTLRRLLSSALSKEIYCTEDRVHEYQKFLLLLCASEISLQRGDYLGSIDHAKAAAGITPSNCDPFFACLQLCRAYVAQEQLPSLRKEYMNCLQLKTTHMIGWISLMYLESRYNLQNGLSAVDLNFQACLMQKESSRSMWEAVFDLARAQCLMANQDLPGAEQSLAHACSIGDPEGCILLCHGSVCMELAKQGLGAQFLSRAAASLGKAQEASPMHLPIVSTLLAQAEASLGVRAKWEKNIRSEWFAWPAEKRPAELYFLMHLLSRQSIAGSNQNPGIESLLRAIHLNPSSSRYWKVLQKLKES